MRSFRIWSDAGAIARFLISPAAIGLPVVVLAGSHQLLLSGGTPGQLR